LANSRT